VDKTLAARRLSAALGRKVAPEDVQDVFEDQRGTTVCVKAEGGSYAIFPLYAGNVTYRGEGTWMKNGHELHEDWFDTNELRPVLRKAASESSDQELDQQIEDPKRWSDARR
jgi:hypothetical protein